MIITAQPSCAGMTCHLAGRVEWRVPVHVRAQVCARVEGGTRAVLPTQVKLVLT